MIRRIFVAVLVLLAATVTLAGEKTVFIDQHQHTEGPTFAQDCHGNLFVFDGSTHLRWTTWMHDDTFHGQLHVNTEGTFTDVNGNRWRIHGSANAVDNNPIGFPLDHAQTHTIISRYRAISMGPGEDTFINFSIHVTRTPDFQYRVNRFEFEVECH